MKTLVLGLGNPIRCDDGVGLRVAQEVRSRLSDQEVTVMEACMSGLDLLHMLADFEKVVIIDAIQTRDGKVGQIYRLTPEVFDATQHVSTPHNINFATALELGRRLGITLPQQIVIFAIEVEDIATYSESCTPGVEPLIPEVADLVIQELEGDTKNP